MTSVAQAASSSMLSAADLVRLFRHLLHGRECLGLLLIGGQAIDGRIEDHLFLFVMGRQRCEQGKFVLITVRVLLLNLLINRFEEFSNTAMLLSHQFGGTRVVHAGLLFEEREQNALFPDDVSLQPEFEFLEEFLGTGVIGVLSFLELDK